MTIFLKHINYVKVYIILQTVWNNINQLIQRCIDIICGETYNTYKYEDHKETVKVLDMFHNSTDDYFNNKFVQFNKIKENKQILLELIKQNNHYISF